MPTKSPSETSQHSGLLNDAKIARQRQLEAFRNCVARDSCDCRFVTEGVAAHAQLSNLQLSITDNLKQDYFGTSNIIFHQLKEQDIEFLTTWK